MTDDELMDALDGLYAYDTGSLDSGIHDEGLRARCIAELRTGLGAGEQVPRVRVGRIVRELYLTDERLEMGYGPEDVFAFLDWLLNSGRMA